MGEVVKRVRRDEFTVVGIRVVALLRDLGAHVPKAWTLLRDRMEHIPNRKDPHILYGVFPEADQMLANPHNDPFTYLVGVEVTAVGELPEGMEAVTIPAQDYAVIRCRGPRSENPVDRAYREVAQWIRARGYTQTPDSLGFERYDERRQGHRDPADPYFDFEIYRAIQVAQESVS